MNPDCADLPIACSLAGPKLGQRIATLLTRFRSSAIDIQELPDGYAFHLPGKAKYLALATAMMVAERKCCPFLKFAVLAHPNMGPVIVEVTGPPGAKDFLRMTFYQPDAP